jgi:hypothetical protein
MVGSFLELVETPRGAKPKGPSPDFGVDSGNPAWRAQNPPCPPDDLVFLLAYTTVKVGRVTPQSPRTTPSPPPRSYRVRPSLPQSA